MARLRTVTVVAVLALAAVACGDDSVTPGSGATTPAGNGSPSTSATPLNDKGTLDATGMSEATLELDNSSGQRYFKPTFIKVKSGQVLKLELENEGDLPHTFTITSLRIDKQVNTGQKDEVTITFPAGTTDVQFFCRFHGNSGMRGAFFFGSAPQTSGSTATGNPASGDSDNY